MAAWAAAAATAARADPVVATARLVEPVEARLAAWAAVVMPVVPSEAGP
jgi:hypothetical protein